ncbi:hypothetical protein MTX20_33570 [Bradyrhizobium sp. ISRA435]|nr:hypothetical protein MTX20_33570 [Bradyrhizobium sp. ISRA435]
MQRGSKLAKSATMQNATRQESASPRDLMPNDDGPLDNSSNEVQFALVIARMIDTVEHSPEHLRQAVYDLARYKLREQFTPADEKDITQTQQALEAAIRGVEEFSRQQIALAAPQVPETRRRFRRSARPPCRRPRPASLATTTGRLDRSGSGGA